MNNNAENNNTKNNSTKKSKAPKAKRIPKAKYFKIGIRDSARVRTIKEGMNHLFTQRNKELEEAFLQEASQYTERILGETRRFHWTEEENQGVIEIIFNNSLEEPMLEEERAEQELEESETDSEEVLALQERIEREDQEEYDRIRAEMEEEEEEANKNN